MSNEGLIQIKKFGSFQANISKLSRKIIRVGLVQINSSFSGQTYFPYSVGILQAYAQKNLSNSEFYEFKIPIYTMTPIEEAVNYLIDADIVGFSVYVWNFENSIAIARELKKRKPDIVIVFGGPHVPDGHKQFKRIRKIDPTDCDFKRMRISMTEEFHRTYPFVDIGCHGEGEQVFKRILERMSIDDCKDKHDLPSVSFLEPDGSFFQNPRIPRLMDLSEIPSPYLSGVFDPLMKKYDKQVWIAMWETDRGCPYQCTYCDWGGAVEDKVSSFSIEQIAKEVEWFSRNKISYIFIANANFGILKQDVKISELLSVAKKEFGYPQAVSVQNAKNPKPHTIQALETLERGGLNKATVMSLQSVNPATLKAVRRDNMKLDEYYEIQKRLASEGVYTMTDIILPMPEETYDSIANGVSVVISRGQHNRIQFNNLCILPNAEMGDPEYQELYGMEIIKTKIINSHGTRNESISGIEEWQNFVVATKTMPRKEWIRARVFCWITGALYFNKLLQIPMIVLHEVYGFSYRELLELFSEKFFLISGSDKDFPVLLEIRNFFIEISSGMLDGRQEEFVHSKEWLNICWPPEEFIFIKLCREGKLSKFYEEAYSAFSMLAKNSNRDVSLVLLRDAITLNQSLIKMPFVDTNLKINLSYNLWDFYRMVLLGKPIELELKENEYVIDRTTEKWKTWEEWYEKMVWYSNRRGAYLYGNIRLGQEIAGHH